MTKVSNQSRSPESRPRSTLRIATRKSPLALWQAEFVSAQLKKAHPDLEVELVTFTTKGDRILGTPLTKVGGKGLFVKELEQALLDDLADIAVHSMKDVPAEFPTGLELSTICARANPFDALVSNHYASIDELPIGARVGTSSLRRKSQLLAKRPDLIILDCRGNVGTRLAKLDAGDYDAIILACAGLERLELASRIRQVIPVQVMLPAAGQGAVGIENRSDDETTKALLESLADTNTHHQVQIERQVTSELGGSCQIPIAAFATTEDGTTELVGLVGDPDSGELITAKRSAPHADSGSLGVLVAKDLIALGAAEVIARVNQQALMTNNSDGNR